MKSRLALLAVPFLALACSDTGQPEALTNPPAPLFAMPVALGNGCIDVDHTGVTVNDAKVTGTSGDDIIDCTASTADLNIDGGDGNDMITGGDGEDFIKGGDGDDDLFGGDGEDDGEDNLFGGKGTDICNVGPGDNAHPSCESTPNIP